MTPSPSSDADIISGSSLTVRMCRFTSSHPIHGPLGFLAEEQSRCETTTMMMIKSPFLFLNAADRPSEGAERHNILFICRRLILYCGGIASFTARSFFFILKITQFSFKEWFCLGCHMPSIYLNNSWSKLVLETWS